MSGVDKVFISISQICFIRVTMTLIIRLLLGVCVLQVLCQLFLVCVNFDWQDIQLGAAQLLFEFVGFGTEPRMHAVPVAVLVFPLDCTLKRLLLRPTSQAGWACEVVEIWKLTPPCWLWLCRSANCRTVFVCHQETSLFSCQLMVPHNLMLV